MYVCNHEEDSVRVRVWSQERDSECMCMREYEWLCTTVRLCMDVGGDVYVRAHDGI